MYHSLLFHCKKSTKLLEDLVAVEQILSLNKKDYENFSKRRENNISNTELKEYLKINVYSITDLLTNIDKTVELLNSGTPENFEKCNIKMKPFESFWEEYLTSSQISEPKKIAEHLDSLKRICNEWVEYFQSQEYQGSESSYSDYSGDSTCSSDDEEEHGSKSKSSSKTRSSS